MSLLTLYIVGVLIVAVLTLAFSIAKSWSETFEMFGLNMILYNILFLILYSFGIYG